MRTSILTLAVIGTLSLSAQANNNSQNSQSGALGVKTGIGLNATGNSSSNSGSQNRGSLGVNANVGARAKGSATGQRSQNNGSTAGSGAASGSTSSEMQGDGMNQSASDLQLNARIQQQLRSRFRNYDSNNQRVTSQNGEVTLQGMVKSRAESQRMEQEARRVSGVTRVHNQLTVDSSGSSSGSENR